MKMSEQPFTTLHAPLSISGVVSRFTLMGDVVFATALAFAYAGCWLGPRRQTPARLVATLSARGGKPLGRRRSHSKGVCFSGVFDANGAASCFPWRRYSPRAARPSSVASRSRGVIRMLAIFRAASKAWPSALSQPTVGSGAAEPTQTIAQGVKHDD
jgi:hypothetical protein